MPPVGSVRNTGLYSYSGVDSSRETTLVQIGETSLSQIAQRLHMDPDDLLAANPQIKDPYHLSLNQHINVPPHDELRGYEGTTDSQPASDLPSRPVGDPLAAGVMKASLDAKRTGAQNASVEPFDQGTPEIPKDACGEPTAGPRDAGICVPAPARTADDRTAGFVTQEQLDASRRTLESIVTAPLMLIPPVAAYETGVSLGEAITGRSSGKHISDFVFGDGEPGGELSTGERVGAGFSAAVGLIGLGAEARAAFKVAAEETEGIAAATRAASGTGDAATEVRAAKSSVQADETEVGAATGKGSPKGRGEEGGIGKAQAKGTDKARTNFREDEGMAANEKTKVASGGRGGKGKLRQESDEQRIRQIDDWNKKGKFPGDPKRLKERLAEGDPKAREEYEGIKADIEKSKRPGMGESRVNEGARIQRMSDANKMELENSGWLKQKLPDPEQRRLFMDWLEKNHKVGEPHIHLRPGSKEAEEALEQFMQEELNVPTKR